MSDYNNLPVWLTEQLYKNKMSPEQLSKRSKMSRAAIYFYLTGVNRPTTNSLARICNVLGASLEEARRQYVEKKRGRPTH